MISNVPKVVLVCEKVIHIDWTLFIEFLFRCLLATTITWILSSPQFNVDKMFILIRIQSVIYSK